MPGPIYPLGILLLLSLLLSACGSVTPVPTDRFYRLPVDLLNIDQGQVVIPGGIDVATLHSDAVYRDRNILFSDDARGLRLQQYGYDLWSESTPELLRGFIQDYLHRAGITKHVSGQQRHGSASYRLEGRLNRFEQRLPMSSTKGQGNVSVLVDLHLKVIESASDRTVLEKTYREQMVVDDDAVLTAVGGLHSAMNTLMGQFIEDLKAVPWANR